MGKNRSDMTTQELERAEKKFIAYYKSSGNASYSAELAGFNHPSETGSRLREKLFSDKDALTAGVNLEELSAEDQKLWVKQFFAGVVTNKKALMKDRITCAKALAEILKMFNEGDEVSNEIESAISKLSREELMRIAYPN